MSEQLDYLRRREAHARTMAAAAVSPEIQRLHVWMADHLASLRRATQAVDTSAAIDAPNP